MKNFLPEMNFSISKRTLIFLSIIFLVGFLSYANTFKDSFHFDDFNYILENNQIHQLNKLDRIWNFWPIRFIGVLTFALNYHFNQDQALGYHVVNFLIHIINGFLVFWLLVLLQDFQQKKQNLKKDFSTHQKTLLAFFGALLFVSHPVQTEAVTYIFQRLASLMTLFYFLSIALYLKAWQFNDRKKTVLLLFSWCFALMAMLTKENAFTLPFALVLIDGFFISSFKEIKQKVIVLIPFGMLLIIIPFLHLTSNSGVLHQEKFFYTPKQYYLTQIHVLWTYLRLLFLPIKQNLDYDYLLVKNLTLITVIKGILLGGLLYLGIRLYSKNRMISFGIIFFFLAHLVEILAFSIPNLICEYRCYLPILGFIMVASGFWFQYLCRFPEFKKIYWVIFLLIPALTWATYARNKTWINEETLWKDVIKKSPYKPRGYQNLGNVYAKQGQNELAFSNYERALSLNSNNYYSYFGMGNIFERKGELKKAKMAYEKAIQLKPNYVEALNNFGVVQMKIGEKQKALPPLKKAVKLKPYYLNGRINLGIAYAQNQNYPKAMEEFQKALDIDPKRPNIHLNLANLQEEMRKK